MTSTASPKKSADLLSEIIDHGPISAQQLRVIGLCMFFNMLDGFDITAMAVVAGAVSSELHLTADRLGRLDSGYDSPMKLTVDTRGRQLGEHRFEDADGYVMPPAPNTSSRRIPLGDFPTGPDVGTRLPEVVAVQALRQRPRQGPLASLR